MLQDLYTKRILSLREHCRLDAVVFADELQQDFSEGESIVKALALTIGNSQNQSAEGLGHVMEIVASRTDIPLDSILLAPNGVVAAGTAVQPAGACFCRDRADRDDRRRDGHGYRKSSIPAYGG